MVYEGSQADASLTESSLVHSASVKEEATNTINCPLLGIYYLLRNYIPGDMEATGKDGGFNVAFGEAPGYNVENKE